MRSLALATIGFGALCGAACGVDKPIDNNPAGPDAPAGDGTLPPPARGFQIVSPTVDINPGVEVTYCYYFHTPNKAELSIQKWASHMTQGSHHMILFLTPTDQQPPGTLLTSQCGFGSGVIGSAWTYSAQTPDAESALPRDDGHGVPVGQPIKADQSGFFQMHYLNASDAVIHAHVELNAYAYDEGVQVTPAGPFVTYNTTIDIDPGSAVAPSEGMVNGTCTVPLNSDGKAPKFYVLTTHSHKQSVHTFVKDGATTVFDSTNWDHPGAMTWTGEPFFSFTSGTLTYQCEYKNPNNYRIQTGDSAATNEMCMAVGYYFPAVGGKGHLCLNSARIY